jgi:hypothetical protein
MIQTDTFETIPAGSLILVNEHDRRLYIDEFYKLPQQVIEMLASPKTGAYIRGLAKNHHISPERCPVIAFSIFQVSTGEKNFAQLSALLSTELKIPNDKAQKLATEIEKELFAPISLELNRYLAKKKLSDRSIGNKISTSPSASSSAPKKESDGMNNILNLKEQKKPPQPPKIPR